ILWARTDEATPWDYALLTGSSSISHALRCGAQLAELTNEPRPDWAAAGLLLADMVATRPDAFEPKDRWAMDWYYPVLAGALTGEEAKARLADGWPAFAMEGTGIRCVNDEPWITASETAECAIAHAAIGDLSTATDLLEWTRPHRRADGSYDTGIVYPSLIRFPADETSAYTGAAVILAADAIVGGSPASAVFVPRSDET
ncbi:MAG: prenyltransferase, partial [Actinobacteria bacterium]|nr:prenyltransferase [Actinomycetota bacterium]